MHFFLCYYCYYYYQSGCDSGRSKLLDKKRKIKNVQFFQWQTTKSNRAKKKNRKEWQFRVYLCYSSVFVLSFSFVFYYF